MKETGFFDRIVQHAEEIRIHASHINQLRGYFEILVKGVVAIKTLGP